MNIVIMGAGAIGSLFGSLLSKNNKVILIGRKPHIDSIKKNGLKIIGKTRLNTKIEAYSSIDDLSLRPDLIILTVKSYDTTIALSQLKKIIDKKTILMSLQNGLNNIEKINRFVKKENIIIGITTNGAIFLDNGVIEHTGIGNTIIGGYNQNIKDVINIFNKAGINTAINNNIIKEIWIKAIINSSINPLTAIFDCKNGYLLKNPILNNLVKKICIESTKVANSIDIKLNYKDMIKKTKQVIIGTADNYSSMLQSCKKNKRSEIDSINGNIVKIGNSNNIDVLLNESLVFTIKSLCKK